MKTIVLRILIVALTFGALFFPARSPIRAADMTCPTHTPVTIDVRPGSAVNPVNLGSQGILPVAVLTTRDFDARQFAPDMAHLTDAATDMALGCAGAMAERWVWDDVNGDRRPDLVFFFRISELDFTRQTSAARFMAHGTYSGMTMHILGTDTVAIIVGGN